MKEMTLKDLSKMINVPVGTVRAWTLKPIPNQPYDSSKINYEQLTKQVLKYVPEFEQKFGFKIEEVQLIKGERTQHDYISADDLSINDEIILHNYALETEMKFVARLTIEDDEVLLFKTSRGFKAYSKSDLEKENMKLRRKEIN